MSALSSQAFAQSAALYDVYVQVNVFTCGYVKLQSVCVSIYESQSRDQTAPAVTEESSLPCGSVSSTSISVIPAAQ